MSRSDGEAQAASRSDGAACRRITSRWRHPEVDVGKGRSVNVVILSGATRSECSERSDAQSKEHL